MEALSSKVREFSDLLDIITSSPLVTPILKIYTYTSSVWEFTWLHTLTISGFWISVNLMGANLYLTFVLVCIFQITRDIEHLFIAYQPYRFPLLLIHSTVHFSTGVLVSLIYVLKGIFYIFWIILVKNTILGVFTKCKT